MKELKFKTLMKDGEFATISRLPGAIHPDVILITKPEMFDDGVTIRMLKAIYRRACEASKAFSEDVARVIL